MAAFGKTYCSFAGHGGIRAIMDDMKLLSTEAEGVREAIPEEHRRSLVNSSERVGALLGLQDKREESNDHDGEAAGTHTPNERDMSAQDVCLSNIIAAGKNSGIL